MNEQTIMALGRDALTVVALVASPLLLVGMAVGLLVSVLQTITSVREQTLTFVPKMAAVLATVLILLPWLLATLCRYAASLLANLDRVAS